MARVTPGLPGSRYKDLDGTMLLKVIDEDDMFIRCVKLGANRWRNTVLRHGVSVDEAVTGSKGQAEMCRRIDALLEAEAVTA